MTMTSDTRILRITTLLVYLLMGFIAFAAIMLALTSVALPVFWSEAVTEIAKENPAADTGGLLPQMLAIFALGLVLLGFVWTIMRKLLAIIRSVESGDPFVVANAVRLRAIGWMMVGVQVIGLPLAVLAGNVADIFGENDVGWDFPVNGVFAILLVFILAGIFEHGAAMREELEGTV